MGRLRAAPPQKAPAHLPITGESVGVCGARLLVGHWTRIALATTRGRPLLALTTGVSVLAAPRFFLATGHGAAFAAVFHVAASFRILVSILRGIEGKGRGRNCQGRAACESDYQCFEFLHLYISKSRNCCAQEFREMAFRSTPRIVAPSC